MKRRTGIVPSGYRFAYEGKRNWRTSKDDKWEITVGDAETGLILGQRRIDGATCTVVKLPSGIVAVTAQSVR